MKLRDSIDQIMDNESLALEGFYDRLFSKYPEFQDYFSKSGLKRQTAMLTMALVSVKQYPMLSAPAQAYLGAIGEKHHGRGIAADLYPKFIEVLVETVAEFHGDDWDETLRRQWTEALSLAAATMNGHGKG